MLAATSSDEDITCNVFIFSSFISFSSSIPRLGGCALDLIFFFLVERMLIGAADFFLSIDPTLSSLALVKLPETTLPSIAAAPSVDFFIAIPSSSTALPHKSNPPGLVTSGCLFVLFRTRCGDA